MTNQAVTISPQHRALEAFNANQDDETLLAGWIHLCRTEVEGDNVRAARATAMNAIEEELVRRGMTHEEFNVLHMTVWAVEGS